MDLPVKYHDVPWPERAAIREEYIKRQSGNCFYCIEPLDKEPPKRITDKPIDWRRFPEGFLNYPIHLQHDHKTDLTEGAVHAYCNAVMWQYEGR